MGAAVAVAQDGAGAPAYGLAALSPRVRNGLAALVLGLLAWGGIATLYAQIDGGNRGIVPINSSQDLSVSGIKVDVTGSSADDARRKGWQEAQRKGWSQLYRQMNRSAGAPALGDASLNGIVSAIVVEQEQISENRYIATLSVLFDRVRAGEVLGVSGRILRSPPLLVLPVYAIDGMPQVFETRNEWQRAWAEFRTGDSSIDYVRTAGTGPDTLLLNAGQPSRRSRVWWRMILDQYGAADVLMPTVRISYAYPGGPVTGHFVARYGPDDEMLGRFTLTTPNAKGIPAMMKQGVERIDRLYVEALSSGRLRADPSLVIEAPTKAEDVPAEETPEDAAKKEAATETAETSTEPAATTTQTFTVQFDSPDDAALLSTESAVRGVAGVSSATTTSVALGGTSVMRVSFAGDQAALRDALVARGFRVTEGGGGLRISR